jgi:hypothetical protein
MILVYPQKISFYIHTFFKIRVFEKKWVIAFFLDTQDRKADNLQSTFWGKKRVKSLHEQQQLVSYKHNNFNSMTEKAR